MNNFIGNKILLQNNTYDIIVSSSNGIYQIGYTNPNIYMSSDSGNSWGILDLTSLNITSLNNISKHNIAINSTGQYITIIISNVGIIYSQDYGVSWTLLNINSNLNLNWTSVAMSTSGQYQTIVSNNDGIYYSYNYGVLWYNTTNYLTNILFHDVFMTSTGQFQITIDDKNNIYYSSNYGVIFTLSTDKYYGNFISINGNDSYIVINTSTNIFYSLNNGVNWTNLDTSTYININYLFAVDDQNNVLLSTDYGQNWRSINNNSDNNSSHLLFNDTYLVAVTDVPHVMTSVPITSNSIFISSTSSGDPHICTFDNEKYTLPNDSEYFNLLLDIENNIIINCKVSLLNKDDFPDLIYDGSNYTEFNKLDNLYNILKLTYYRYFYIKYNDEKLIINADTLECINADTMDLINENNLKNITITRYDNLSDDEGLYGILSNIKYKTTNRTKKIIIKFGNYKFNITSDITTDERHYCKLEINNTEYNKLYGGFIKKEKLLKPNCLSGNIFKDLHNKKYIVKRKKMN